MAEISTARANLARLLITYDRWYDQREVVSGLEENGTARPRDWEDSDDQAVDLLIAIAANVRQWLEVDAANVAGRP